MGFRRPGPSVDSAVRLLTVTTLYPNREMPNHGVFVENRLRKIVETEDVEARVIAPVSWFPLTHPAFGRYGRFARVPDREERNGLAIDHPRYLSLPKVGTRLHPGSMYRAMLGRARAIQAAGFDCDLVDGQYFYPDGVAAARLARALGKPVVVTARGADLNMWPQHPFAGPLIRQTIKACGAVVTVSASLARRVEALSDSTTRIEVLRNGVDLERFRPVDRQAARADLGLSGFTALSVGQLIERKGHDLAIRALADLPDITLVICGDGPLRQSLETLARECGVADRVRFAGQILHDDLPCYYTAADVLLLMSASEGWPNVLLESMACGTAVVATAVDGVPEVVQGAAAGLLVGRRDVAAVRDTLRRFVAAPPTREATRTYAEGFGWEETAARQAQLYRDVIAEHAAAGGGIHG